MFILFGKQVKMDFTYPIVYVGFVCLWVFFCFQFLKLRKYLTSCSKLVSDRRIEVFVFRGFWRNEDVNLVLIGITKKVVFRIKFPISLRGFSQ